VGHFVVPDGTDLFAVLERLTYQQDEPAAGPGLYSQWKVMELARTEGLKVLLDGQGGDETLAGYHRYYLPALRDLVAGGRVGSFLRALGPVADRIGWPTTLAGVMEPVVPRRLFASLRRRFGQGKDRVLTPAFRRARGLPDPAPPPAERGALWRQLAFDVQQRFLPSLLRYEDRNSMAFSIETRLPFLDYRLVELAFSLPDDQKLQGVTTKVVLRRALGGRLPDPVRVRADKMGYETPTDVWLRTRYARDARERLAREGLLHDYVDGRVLLEELDRYLAGSRDIGLQVWRWLNLEAWLRQFVARDPRVWRRDGSPERAGGHVSYEEATAGLD
jgi:asparagine synthase (glutamine-hydrolysing)